MKKAIRKILMVLNGLLACVLLVLLTALLVSHLDAGTKALKPYVVSFGDSIAIRCLHDGSIEATVEAYEEADWKEFQENGYLWSSQYTDAEYRAIMKEKDSIRSFAQMQASTDYVDVSSNCYGTLAAVHADGSVAFNQRARRRYDVSEQDAEWNNVKELELGAYAVLALKKDGTAVSAVNPAIFEFTLGTRPETWRDVRTIACDIMGVGLRKDGTVCWTAIDTEDLNFGQFVSLNEIDSWTDIIQVDTSWGTAAGLRSDGTVVLAGDVSNGKSAACSWTDIQKIAVGMQLIVGLKKDGTVVSTAPWLLDGEEKLKNVADLYANRHYVLVILKNGKVRLLGNPEETTHDGAWPAGKWIFPVES